MNIYKRPININTKKNNLKHYLSVSLKFEIS